MAKDLVCNMEVDEKTAKWKTIYQGKTYYFCAPGCKKEFESNPQEYVDNSTNQSGHSCCCGGQHHH
ncbi:MAG: YHS domain-containing protein [Candidatus Bathyarchaeota archaeon]|nr:YHS domain-containing protein [Candidatus Bathyarchaeota archaeon]